MKSRFLWTILSVIIACSFTYYILNPYKPLPYYITSKNQNDRTLSSKNDQDKLTVFDDYFSDQDYFMFIRQKMKIKIKGFTESQKKDLLVRFMKKRLGLAGSQHDEEKFFIPKSDFLYQFIKFIKNYQSNQDSSTKRDTLEFELQFFPESNYGLGPDAALKGQSFNLPNVQNKTKPDQNLSHIISKIDIPYGDSALQMLGGSIVVKYNSNEGTGNICFRRYFRINDKSQFKFTLNSSSFKMEYFHFKNLNSKEKVLTADLFQKFNDLDTPAVNTFLKVYIDSIVESDPFEKNGLKKIKNSKFIIRGGFSYAQHHFSTTTYLNSLIYSFEENQFLGESEIITKSNHTEYKPLANEISNIIKVIFLEENKTSIIKSFLLRRFSNEIH